MSVLVRNGVSVSVQNGAAVSVSVRNSRADGYRYNGIGQTLASEKKKDENCD